MRFFTVSSLDDKFNTLDDAIKAWNEAGCPRQSGSSVWVTEYLVDNNGFAKTLRTITIG